MRFPSATVAVQYEGMNTSETSGARTNVDSDPSPKADFRKLFVTGVGGWLLGIVALYGAAWAFAKPENATLAMMWTVSRLWIAFAGGLALMAVIGLLKKTPLAMPLIAYALPALVLAAVAGICIAVYPDAGFRSDLITYLPGVWVFYLFSVVWMTLRSRDAGAFQQAVIPALVGGLVVLGFVALPAFSSDAFAYRSAFRLTGGEPEVQDGQLTFEGELEITKAGNYEFSAPRYILTESDDEADGGLERGEIRWGRAGAPKEGATGKFPLQITWKKGVITEASGGLPASDEAVMLEVRRQDQGGRFVYTIDAENASAP